MGDKPRSMAVQVAATEIRPGARDAPPRISGRLRLRTLVLIRWVAIVGQVAALLFVHFGLGYAVPMWEALALVGASIAVNLWASRARPAARLGDRAAARYLAYDLLQLAGLLYLTGGLHNPFAILILAPVTVSATSLSWRSTLALSGLALAAVVLLSLLHWPLPWPGDGFRPTPVFILGLAMALALSVVFIANYVFRVAEEGRQMSDALAAAQMALDREQRISAVGSLAAAAAHELGSPLGTIAVVAKEIARDLPANSPLRPDVELLLSESGRCRDILARLSARPEVGEPEGASTGPQPLSAVLGTIAESYRRAGVRLAIDAAPDRPGERASPEPRVARTAELLHGLGNLLENAIEFAAGEVRVAVRWDAAHISVTITDDGPGFDPNLIGQLGEPYRSGGAQGREGKSVHMGLGVFIAQTLLERTGASVAFRNAETGGAEVRIVWPRAALEAAPAARQRRAG